MLLTIPQSQPSAQKPSMQVERFFTRLAKKYEQWQVDQARHAIQRYCYFLERPHLLYRSLEHPESIKDWMIAGETMRCVLQFGRDHIVQKGPAYIG